MKAWQIYNKINWCKNAAFLDKNGENLSFSKKVTLTQCGACCILGAIELAYRSKDYNKLADKLEKFLKTKYKKIKHKGDLIFHVNDYVLTSKEEAQQILKKANI